MTRTHVLAGWFVAFKAMAENAPGPTQKVMATRCAGEVLWELGLKEYKGFQAVQPVGATIDMSALPLDQQVVTHQLGYAPDFDVTAQGKED